MGNRRWELSDAAVKRIRGRVEKIKSSDRGTGSVLDSAVDHWALLLEAMEPENFASPRRIAKMIALCWIREGSMGWLTAGLFEELHRDRAQLRKAGSDIMNGIRAMGRMKL